MTKIKTNVWIKAKSEISSAHKFYTSNSVNDMNGNRQQTTVWHSSLGLHDRITTKITVI